MATKTKIALVPLIVTTLHKGVFFGYGTPDYEKEKRLEKAQMCIYWSSDCKGILGLAADGPTKNCKIGPIVPAISVSDVTSVMEVSEKAVKAWEKQPWN